MAAKSASRPSLHSTVHSRLSSSSSESDTAIPDTSDGSTCDTVEFSRRICHSARMRGRRHAVDHGRETPIPVENLELLMSGGTVPAATTTTQKLSSTDKSKKSSSTTATTATRKIRANCTTVSAGK